MQSNRISRHQMFLEMAEVASKRSTCFRANVGALIVKNNNIVSMGYNGAPPKQPHCLGNACELKTTGGCANSIHAEINALTRSDGQTQGAILYTTHSPCPDCARALVKAKINLLVYRNKYRIDEGINILLFHGIKVLRITESGYIINEKTNAIEEETKSYNSKHQRASD